MELSNDLLIDLGLNIAGFLAAGGLLVIVYSLIRGLPERARKYVGRPAAGKKTPPPPDTIVTEGRHRLEFVKLGEESPGVADERASAQRRHSSRLSDSARRDRLEVMSLARKLRDAGATNERIKAVLPISDGELALLNYSRK